jgi:hypothetical protein
MQASCVARRASRGGVTEMRTSMKRWLAWSGAALALAAVFMLYINPDVAVTLANQIWNCF